MGQTSILGGKRVFLLALVMLLLAGAVVVWAERKVLLTWYYLHGLKHAEGDEVRTWAERTASLDEAVVPELLRLLGRDEPRACDNASQALLCLAERWGREDARCAELTDEIVKAFPQLGASGQREALRLVVDWARPPCPEGLVQASARLLTELAHHLDPEFRARGLD